MEKLTAMRLTAKGFLLLAVMAAGCGHDDRITGVFAPGASGLIVLTRVQAAGGNVYQETITVDSASAQFEYVTCVSSAGQSACGDQQRRVGEVNPATLGQLFGIVQTPSFEQLRETYDREGDVVPPDGSWTQVTVTVAERTKTVRWAGGATLPQILVRFNCWMESVRGSLIACA
jgi:hypothetical protein